MKRIVNAAAVLLFGLMFLQLAEGQTYSVIHSFTGGPDGANPLAGLAMDQVGNLYGTTSLGGQGRGTVYKLAPRGGGWIFTPVYQFQGATDGKYPEAGVTIGPDGLLYGTTFYGGNTFTACLQGSEETCGTIFRLQPKPTACTGAICPWNETQLYLGSQNPALFFPNAGELIFDSAHNFYGVSFQGGSTVLGAVYELSPSGEGWTVSTLYNFMTQNGYNPLGGVIFGPGGVLYGTTYGNGQSPDTYGIAYQLTPSGSGWTETILHVFEHGSDGAWPKAGLTMDSAGNLYGTTSGGGPNSGGTVFELSPSDNGWTFSVLHSFNGPPNRGSFGPLLLDPAGNLYGTTLAGGASQQGAVFKLTNSGGVWTYTSLHDFTGGADGRSPYGHLLLDSSGNLYGTAGWGGNADSGVVWKIAP